MQGNTSVIDDIADLIIELNTQESVRKIALKMGIPKSTVQHMKDGISVVLRPELLAGLRAYGYDLKLVKRGE